MTVFEVHIERLVLRGLPADYHEGLDAAIAEAIGAAAHGRLSEDSSPRTPLAGPQELAHRIGHEVWSGIRGAQP